MDIRRHLGHMTYFMCGLAFTGCLIGAQLTEAATYYVATNGSDSRSCSQAQNQATPKGTINGGLACISGGETLVIKPGTYAERIGTGRIPSGSSDSKRTVVKAETAGTVTLRPSAGFIIHFSSTQGYITLDGLKLDGTLIPEVPETGGIKIDGDGNGPPGGGHHITVRNMEITNILHDSCVQIGGEYHVFSDVKISNCIGKSDNGKHGLYWQAANGLLDRVEVVNTTGIGIQLYYSKNSNAVVNNVIRNSIFRNIGKRGIYIGGKNNEIYNNLIYKSGSDGQGDQGIKIQNTGNIVRNNIIYSTNGPDPILDNVSGNTLSNNLCRGHASCVVTSDPKFINPSAGNFHLQPDSPVIDRGAMITKVANDYDGLSRPQGAAYDIGTYEYKKVLSRPSNLRIISAQ
jgi:hypothetical protein